MLGKEDMRLVSAAVGFLLSAMIANKQTGPGRATFLPPARDLERVKAVGRDLHERGGLALMQLVGEILQAEVRARGASLDLRGDLRELDYLWDGIGDWRA